MNPSDPLNPPAPPIPRKSRRRLVLAVALLLLGAAVPAWPRVVEGVAAVVEGEPITLSELNRFIARGTAVPRPDLPRGSDRKRWLEFLIEERLIEKEAERIGITVSETEVDEAIADLLRANSLSPADLARTLQESGIAETDYRREIRSGLIRSRVLDREIQPRVFLSEDKARTYYQENLDRFSLPSEQRISQIVISRSQPQAEERLKQVQRLLREGRDFAEVAREYSDDPSARNGGDLGFFALAELRPELREVLERLPPRKPSEPVRTSESVRILLITAQKPAAPLPFEQVKSRVMDELYRREIERGFRNWLEGIKSRARIEIKSEP